MRSEKWTDTQEIKRILVSGDTKQGGPLLYSENGTHYCDTSESHVLITGKTRSGKTSTGVKNYIRNEIEAGHCVVSIDPKGEIMRSVLPYAKNTHNVIILDFRHPSSSPDRWNPLESPAVLFQSGEPESMDIASTMVSSFASQLYPTDVNADPFWNLSSATLVEGVIYTLFELCNVEYCNLSSIIKMMESLETKIGTSFLLKEFTTALPEESLARKAFSSYNNAEGPTRASIHSVCATGLAPFSRSRGIKKMLSNGTVRIHELDVAEAFFVDIILPDESSEVYGSIAGLFVSQVTEHLIRLAEDKYNGKLPRKTTIFIEELASVSGAMKNLPRLMSTALGRNISICLVLQDPYSQLQDLYGPAKAKAIQANVGVTIAYSTNDWESLRALSAQCGERELDWDGRTVNEPLITPHQLAALNTGCCLILLQNRYKWVTKIPFYSDAFQVNLEELSNCVFEEKPLVSPGKIFDMEEFVKEKRRLQIEKMMQTQDSTATTPSPQCSLSDEEKRQLIAKIQKRIQEEEQRAKKDDTNE